MENNINEARIKSECSVRIVSYMQVLVNKNHLLRLEEAVNVQVKYKHFFLDLTLLLLRPSFSLITQYVLDSPHGAVGSRRS